MNTTHIPSSLCFVSRFVGRPRAHRRFWSIVALLTLALPVTAQLNQNAPVWSSYSPGHFYHRDFSVAGYSTTASPNALPLSEPDNVDYTFPTYGQPGNGFYEYANGTNFTDPRDSSQRCTIPPGDANQAPPTANRYWIISSVYNHSVPVRREPQSAHVSDFQSGIKGLLFQGEFSGTASGGTSDAALAVVYYHQEACYAGHFEYGFAYDFVPQVYPGTMVQKSPFYFYWSKETNCFGTCFADVSGTIPVPHEDGTTNDLATTTPTLRYTPLPDLRTTMNSAGQYVWGVSAYFDYSSGGNFRVQIWDPINFSLLYDQIITPVINTGLSGTVYTTTPFDIDQVSGGAAGSPSYAVNGTSAYVTAGFSLVGSPTPGTLPNFHLDYLKAGK